LFAAGVETTSRRWVGPDGRVRKSPVGSFGGFAPVRCIQSNTLIVMTSRSVTPLSEVEKTVAM
jgi:hypothetical protein